MTRIMAPGIFRAIKMAVRDNNTSNAKTKVVFSKKKSCQCSLFRCRLTGLGIATEDGKTFYVPLSHRYIGVPDQLPHVRTPSWPLGSLYSSNLFLGPEMLCRGSAALDFGENAEFTPACRPIECAS